MKKWFSKLHVDGMVDRMQSIERIMKSKEFQAFIQVLIIQIVRLKFRVGNSNFVWVKIITLSEKSCFTILWLESN